MTLTFVSRSSIALHSPLNISETVRDRGLVPRHACPIVCLSHGWISQQEAKLSLGPYCFTANCL